MTWQTNDPLNHAGGGNGISSSADGTKLIAALWSGVYFSTNSGQSWSVILSNIIDSATASSALGDVLAVSTSGYPTNQIFVSTNYGLTWCSTSSLPITRYTTCRLAASADGTMLYAMPFYYSNNIYLSTNFGNTWTSTSSATDSWYSIAGDAGGDRLIASGTATYISTNFGGIWTKVNSTSGTVLLRFANFPIKQAIYTDDADVNRSRWTQCGKLNEPVEFWNARTSTGCAGR